MSIHIIVGPWTYDQMCDHLLKHGTVHVNGVETPLRELPDWVAGLELLRREERELCEPEFGVQQGTFEEMYAAVHSDLLRALERLR